MGIFDRLFGKKRDLTQSKGERVDKKESDEVISEIIPIRSYFIWWKSVVGRLIDSGLNPTEAGRLVNIFTNAWCPICNLQYTKDALSILLNTTLSGGLRSNVTIIPGDSIFVDVPDAELPENSFMQLYNNFRCPKCGNDTMKVIYKKRKYSVEEIVSRMEKEPTNVDAYVDILVEIGSEAVPSLIECFKKYSPEDIEDDKKFSTMAGIIDALGSIGDKKALEFLYDISKINYSSDYFQSMIKTAIKNIKRSKK